MASWQAHFWSFFLRYTFKRRLARAGDIAAVRAVMDQSLFQTPADIRVTNASLGCGGEWIEHDRSGPHEVLLYIHGGGYIACSTRTHRPYTTAFARRGFRVYAPEYRLAPEHRFPAGLDDAVDAYRALRAAEPDARITVAGDSAGGGLSLALLLRLRDSGDPLPARAALFSPLTDLTGIGASRQRNDGRCAMFHERVLRVVADYYLAPGADPADPLASPLFGDFRGLPPLLIHAGANETLLDDSTALATRAKAAGVDVTLKIWPVVPHVWQMMPMPEARQSLDESAAFLLGAR